MVRAGTVAVALGVVAGAWVALASYLGSFQPNCFGVINGGCGTASLLSTLITALAVVLVLDSLASLVAPRKAFYASASLSALLAALAAYAGLVAGTIAYLGVELSIVVCVVSFAVDMVAARSRGSVSEQSNPMNLPVFG